MAEGASEWTVDTLKEHFDSLREADQRAINSALASAEKAVAKADSATEKRFEGVNELRGLVNDVMASRASRDYVDGKFDAVSVTLTRLEQGAATTQGRTGLSTPIISGLAVAAVGILAALTGHLH